MTSEKISKSPSILMMITYCKIKINVSQWRWGEQSKTLAQTSYRFSKFSKTFFFVGHPSLARTTNYSIGFKEYT
jgi:hypothetical protein